MSKSKAKDDPEKRIEDLKRRAEELSGGDMEIGTLDDCSAETEEAFWKHLVDYEEAPWTTHFQQLESAGVSLPPPESLKDEELTAKLWEVIQKLALLHVFIEQTDHLSDRELYTYLVNACLREETKAMPMAANSAYHIQLLSSGSDKITFSTSSITPTKTGAGNGIRNGPRIPCPSTKTHSTTATAYCPSMITLCLLTKSPTELKGWRMAHRHRSTPASSSPHRGRLVVARRFNGGKDKKRISSSRLRPGRSKAERAKTHLLSALASIP